MAIQIGANAATVTGTAKVAVHRYNTIAALFWELPDASNLWCKCNLSGANGDLPELVRRKIANPKSSNGIARTANGKKSGNNAGPMFSSDIALASICPVRVIADAARISPNNIDPESPINMRAGFELCGKKPMHNPIKITVIKDGAPARVKPLDTANK